MRYRTISQIGTFTQLSNDTDDYLAIRPSACSGGADAPQRTTLEDAPGRDGVLVFPPLDGAQIISLVFDTVVTSTGLSVEAGYREALDTLLGSFADAVTAMKFAPDAIVHSGGTLLAWKHGEIDHSWDDFETICAVTCSFVVDVFA